MTTFNRYTLFSLLLAIVATANGQDSTDAWSGTYDVYDRTPDGEYYPHEELTSLVILKRGTVYTFRKNPASTEFELEERNGKLVTKGRLTPRIARQRDANPKALEVQYSFSTLYLHPAGDTPDGWVIRGEKTEIDATLFSNLASDGRTIRLGSDDVPVKLKEAYSTFLRWCRCNASFWKFWLHRAAGMDTEGTERIEAAIADLTKDPKLIRVSRVGDCFLLKTTNCESFWIETKSGVWRMYRPIYRENIQ